MKDSQSIGATPITLIAIVAFAAVIVLGLSLYPSPGFLIPVISGGIGATAGELIGRILFQPRDIRLSPVGLVIESQRGARAAEAGSTVVTLRDFGPFGFLLVSKEGNSEPRMWALTKRQGDFVSVVLSTNAPAPGNP